MRRSVWQTEGPSLAGGIVEAWVLIVVLVFAALPAQAQKNQADLVRLRAENLARSGNCQDAQPLLDGILRSNSKDAIALFLSGQCAIRARDYAVAAAQLEQAQALNPGLRDIDLYIGIARYHMEDYDAARASLHAARVKGTRAAELELYEGLLLVQEGRNDDAARMLERSRRMDPDIDAMASYYAGLAWIAAKRDAKGKKSLEHVVASDAQSTWGRQAQRVLDGLAQGELKRWGIATLGAEYDDNVVLRGDGVRYAGELSDESDWRAVWTLEGGAELLKRKNTTFGVLASYYGSAHRDLEDFNVEYPKIGFWFDQALGQDTSFRLQYDYGYAWIGGNESYLTTHTVTPSVFHDFGKVGHSRFFVQATRESYFVRSPDVTDGVPGPGGCLDPNGCGPLGMNETEVRDPDGIELIGGVEHELPPFAGGLRLRGAYRVHYLTTQGQEYNYSGHEAVLGLRVALPLSVELDASGRYFYRSYRHPSSYPDPRDMRPFETYPLSDRSRREKEIGVDVSLERPIARQFSVLLRYHYTNNQSNVAVFDYDRNLVGLFLKARF